MILDLKATAEDVMRGVEWLKEFGESNNLSDKAIFALMLAMEECASNIVHHAYQGDASQTFQLRAEFTGDAVMLELRDHGPEFDPTRHLQAPSGARREAHGNWGLQLVRRYMDRIDYRREENQNILRLTKGGCANSAGSAQAHSFPQNELVIHKPKVPMPLETQILKHVDPQHAGSTTVKLIGSLDTATAPELERQLIPVLAEGVKELVFDLAELKFVSSAGLRVFSSTRKQLRERGGQAAFIHMQPQIQEVFEIMKSLPGIAIFKDMNELDRYLSARQRSYSQSL